MKKEEEDFRNYYDIIKKIGEGGFGIVYEVKLKETEELRAIKVIDKKKIIDIFINENLRKPNEEEMKIYINSFFNEIENMKLIEGKNKENENTVKFYEYFHTENEFCIVMELCDGNLFEILSNKENDQGFKVYEIYNILNQLNNTFRIMVENKLVHRDLKLQNILIKYKDKEKKDYIVKLTDYGISKHLLSLTRKLSTQIGTFNMMAPEILEGKQYDEKCDLWSLGIIIFILYFHKYPYNGMNEFDILNQINNLNQKIIKKTGNVNLDNLILKLLTINPKERITWKAYFNHPFFNNNSIKVVLIGESGVDKLSIINNFTKPNPNEISSSLSSQFGTKTLDFPDLDNSVKFDIWDTAGEEKYRSLAKIFYKDAQVIIFVYDITCKQSFEEIKNYWYEEVKANVDNQSILAVVGNKIELYNDQQVSNEEGRDFARKIGAIFQLTSTISDIGVNELFENIGKTYLTGNLNYYWEKEKENEIKEFYKKEEMKEKKEKKRRLSKIDNVKVNKGNIKKNCIIV